VLLNLYPYNNGHLMVVPNRHIADLKSAGPAELNEMMQLTRLSELVVTEAYRPHGINVGINLGRPAGAGILHHLHVHLVPRWNGDTNFMTVVGETRVLPEDLSESAARLRPLFARAQKEQA
jgi:ATP adenylyltransferase